MQAERLAREGAKRYRWLALEYDDYDGDQTWPIFRAACKRHGLRAGTWVTHGENIDASPLDADFWIAEDEGPSDRQGIINSRAAKGWLLPELPKAIIGNGWHDATSKAELIGTVNNGWYFLTEMYSYTDDGQPTGYTPAGLADNAIRNLGFPAERVQPCFGIFGGATPASYDPFRPSNPGWSEYIVEAVIPNA